MKTPEERLNELEKKEEQRAKDSKDFAIIILIAVAFVLLCWSAATSAAGYESLKEILEILKK